MEVITYSLREDCRSSDRYFADVAVFSDEVIGAIAELTGGLPAAFQAWIAATGRERVRSTPEYALELLTLGVLWQVYGDRAAVRSDWPRRLLASLARLRDRNPALQPIIDGVRGGLMTRYAMPSGSPSTAAGPTAAADIDALLAWLAATGSFEQAVKRLQSWSDFLATRPPDDLEPLTALAGWFEDRSTAVLGRYTPCVEHFLAHVYPGYRWRHDLIFCGRQRVEYHLAMVGTEILNRAFRAGFLAAQRKLVILPPCMKARADDDCRAQSTPFGARCAACTPGCHVRRVTEQGEELGFGVLIHPDELATFADGGPGRTRPVGLGVVGVSCVLTNPPGGWEMKDLGVPAQGLPLDYCGCSYHWHPEGFLTDINGRQLLRVLECVS
jgi:hypothetical protein